MKKSHEEVLDLIEQALKGQAHLEELVNTNKDPFLVLISTILSARTRDENTRAATISLFSKFKTPREIARANVEELEKLIHRTGFYKVKAARIKDVSEIIFNKYNGVVPRKFEELVSLPGVGPKTANCVLVYAFNEPAIPVDTHVHRISNRLEWVNTNTPEKTEKELRAIIPRKLWLRINRLFVRFGQEICLPNRPKCHECPLDDFCPKSFSMEIKRKAKKKTKK